MVNLIEDAKFAQLLKALSCLIKIEPEFEHHPDLRYLVISRTRNECHKLPPICASAFSDVFCCDLLVLLFMLIVKESEIYFASLWLSFCSK